MAAYSGPVYGVYIFTHGHARAIWFDEGLGISIDGYDRRQTRSDFYTISELNMLTIQGTVHLLGCNVGSLDMYWHGRDGHNFASKLSTRVTGGPVTGFDGSVGFGPAASRFTAPLTGNWAPRLSHNQNSFHQTRGYLNVDNHRRPAGRQQFLGGQLNNSLIAPPGGTFLRAL